mgnify:CR=1 FL=1
MTRTTMRGLATGAVVLGFVLAGSAALAGQGFRAGREGAPGRGLRAALASLDLTDSQKEKVKALLEAEKPKFEALRHEGRAAREALKSASEAPTPDPAAVGAAFLKVKALRGTARAERDSSRKALEALLTAEQKAKLDGWRAAHRQMRRGPGGPEGAPPPGRGPSPPVD